MEEKSSEEAFEEDLKSAFCIFGILSLVISFSMVSIIISLVKQIKAANKRLYGDAQGQGLKPEQRKPATVFIIFGVGYFVRSLWDLIFAFKQDFSHGFFGMVLAYDIVSMGEAIAFSLLLSLHGKYYKKRNNGANRVLQQSDEDENMITSSEH